MKNAAFNYFFIIIFCLFSCSKKGAFQEKLLEKDPSVHESFGWKINFTSYSYPNWGGHVWGTPSQFFITAANGLLKADFDRQSLTNITPGGSGYVTGLTADGSQLIIAGKINNQRGYFTYSIPGSGPITPAISLEENEQASLLISGNHMLLGTSTVVITGTSCASTSPWNFWCYPISTVIRPYTLYHIDAATQTSTVIGSQGGLQLFSADRRKALITGNNRYNYYDLELRRIIDSFPINNTGSIFWGNGDPLLLNAEINDNIVIRNARTGLETDRIQISSGHIEQGTRDILWGPTGKKIYYTGKCQGSGCTYAIWSFDLDTRQEKQHVITTDTAPLTSPFEGILVSPDETKMVFRHINSLYLKILE